MSRSRPPSYAVYGIALILTLSFLLILIPPASAGAICYDSANTTYVQLNSDCNAPGQFCNVEAYVYTMVSAPGATTPKSEGVSGGLVILSWGQGTSRACKMVTGSDGKNTAKLSGPNYPPGATCWNVRAVFCPFTKDNTIESGQTTMAACAGLVDDAGKSITRIDWNQASQLPDCAAPAHAVNNSAMNQDLSPFFRPSQDSTMICNSGPSAGQVSFCWGLALVFGLLFSASFLSGRNPLMFFDFGVARGVRMNRAAGIYTPITQNVSINPVAILQAIDKAGSMASTAVGSGSKDDEYNKNSDGTEKSFGQKMDAAGRKGFITNAVGKTINGLSDSLFGKLTGQSSDDLTKSRNAASKGFTLSNALNSVGQRAMEGMVLGALGTLAGGKFGKIALAHTGKEVASQMSKAAGHGIASGLEAVTPNADLAKNEGNKGLSDKDRAEQLKVQIAAALGIKDLSLLNVVSDSRGGYSVKMGDVVVGGVTRPNGADGPPLCTFNDISSTGLRVSNVLQNLAFGSSAVTWVILDPGKGVVKGADGKWALADPSNNGITGASNIFNREQMIVSASSGGVRIQLPNGQWVSMSGSSAFSDHVATILDSIGLFVQGQLNILDLLKSILSPVLSVGTVASNAFAAQNHPTVQDATRIIEFNNQNIFIKSSGVYEKDETTGELKPIGTYDVKTETIKFTNDIHDPKNPASESYLEAGATYKLSPDGTMTLVDKAHPPKALPVVITTAAKTSVITIDSDSNIKSKGLDGEKVAPPAAPAEKVNVAVKLANVNGGGEEKLDFTITPMTSDHSGTRELVTLSHFDPVAKVNLQVIAEVDNTKKPTDTDYIVGVKAIVNRAPETGGHVVVGEVLSIGDRNGTPLKDGKFTFDNNTYGIGSATLSSDVKIELKSPATQTAPVKEISISPTTPPEKMTVIPLGATATSGDPDAKLVLATTLNTNTQYVMDNTNEANPKVLAVIKRDEDGHATAYKPNADGTASSTEIDKFVFHGTQHEVDITTRHYPLGSEPSTVVISDTRVVDGASGDAWKAQQTLPSGEKVISFNGTTCTVRETEVAYGAGSKPEMVVYDGGLPVGTAQFDDKGHLQSVTIDYDNQGRKLYDLPPVGPNPPSVPIAVFGDYAPGTVVKASGPEGKDPELTEYLNSSQMNRHMVFDAIGAQLASGIDRFASGMDYFGLFGKKFSPEGGMQWLTASLYSEYVKSPIETAQPGRGFDSIRRDELRELYEKSGAEDYDAMRREAEEKKQQEVTKWVQDVDKFNKSGAAGPTPPMPEPLERTMPSRYVDYLVKQVDAGIAPVLSAPFTEGIPYRVQDKEARHESVLFKNQAEFDELNSNNDPNKYAMKIIEKINAYENDLLKRVNSSAQSGDPNYKPFTNLGEALLAHSFATTEDPNIVKPTWAKNLDPDLVNEMSNYMKVSSSVKKLDNLTKYYEKQGQ